ncbi:MAG: SUMF1/EgtB/PvdO family nonheme iron enzyme [Deltaproteobacteria bacterium]|nr:SUMF1/EgtB/PvdO family nonheme iron enzyme [Deltaproteobacteria bacterium]
MHQKKALLSWLLIAAAWPAQGSPAAPPWPFSATIAKKLQQRAAVDAHTPVTRTIALGKGERIVFKLIPPGRFVIGSPPDESGHEPDEEQRWAEVADPYYVATTVLTKGQWEAAAGAVSDEYAALHSEQPMPFRFDDVSSRVLPALQAFAPVGWRFVLMGDEPFEFATRAGAATIYPTGTNLKDFERMAWCKGNSGGRVHEVAQLQPNAFGLYDMLGNMWQWVDAEFVRDKTAHIVRGGSFDVPAKKNGCRSANRMISRVPVAYRPALVRVKAPSAKVD